METLTLSQQMAANVRAELARRRIPTLAVADWLNLGGAATRLRLKGHMPFNVDELGRLAELLGVPACELIAAER